MLSTIFYILVGWFLAGLFLRKDRDGKS